MLKIALTTLAILTYTANAHALTAPCPEGQVNTTAFVNELRSYPNVKVYGYQGDSADAARTYIEMVIQKKAKVFDQIIFSTQKNNPKVLLSLGLNGCVFHSTEIGLETWRDIKLYIDGY